MFAFCIGLALMSLAACLIVICIAANSYHAHEKRLEEDKKDVNRLYKAMRRLD